MLWLFIAILGPIFHGLSNVLDNYLVNRLVRDPFALVFYSSLLNLLFLPFVFLFAVPSVPSLSLIPFYLLLGLINLAYLYPYYKALQSDDTSVVVSLFSLEKLLVPFLAFFIVGELLSVVQYIGFFIVVLCGALLTLNGSSGRFSFRLNSSFFYMSIVSLILAFESVLFKYVFNSADWVTGFTWAVVSSILVALPLLVFRNCRMKIRAQWFSFRKNVHLFALEELLTFGGTAASTFAISLVPVTLVTGVYSFQPFFVLLYAVCFKRFFPNMFQEKIDVASIVKKSFLFIVMVLGIVLITK